MNNEENQCFDYCKQVDLHALDFNVPIENIVSIAGEHGFRGIVVSQSNLKSLVKALKEPLFGNERTIPICVIDYPFGNSGKDVRAYSLQSAKENGAKEVEVIAPYDLIAQKDFKSVYNDIFNLLKLSKTVDIDVKYVFDKQSMPMDDDLIKKVYRVISAAKIPILSTSVGYFENKDNHADNVLQMRNFKMKTGVSIKAYLKNCKPEDVASYVKAGVDIMGIEWKNAPYVVHAYEYMIEKK